MVAALTPEKALLENPNAARYHLELSNDGAIQFPEKIRRSIAKCDVFVCLLARETLQSLWVREEIRFAHELGLPMIPVLQENWESLSPEDSADESLRSLLTYDGVRVLDQRNLYVKEAIKDVADLVRGPATR